MYTYTFAIGFEMGKHSVRKDKLMVQMDDNDKIILFAYWKAALFLTVINPAAINSP